MPTTEAATALQQNIVSPSTTTNRVSDYFVSIGGTVQREFRLTSRPINLYSPIACAYPS